MNNHLDQDRLAAYIYRTLDDASRETIDAHLADCASCRARLADQEGLKQQIGSELAAALGSRAPSRSMSFFAISDRLQEHRPLAQLWQRMAHAPAALFAATGLLLSVVGLWEISGLLNRPAPGQDLGPIPTLACFFFMLASVGQTDSSISIRPRWALTVLVTAMLWLGTAFIGLLNIFVIRDLAILAVVSLGGRAVDAAPVAILAVMGATMLYIGLVIGGAEYHYRNLGQPGSWKVFSMTLLVQLFILLMPYWL